MFPFRDYLDLFDEAASFIGSSFISKGSKQFHQKITGMQSTHRQFKQQIHYNNNILNLLGTMIQITLNVPVV